MLEQDRTAESKKAGVFNRPNPYDLVVLSATFDDRQIVLPPRAYIPATDPEKQLADVTTDLQNAFGDQLMFVGLTGSRIDHPDQTDRDLDVLAIVDDNASMAQLTFQGDLKIVSYSGLREFIECGHQLIASQFRKAKPTFLNENAQLALEEARLWKVIPEKAIPFLITKSRFNEQSSDIYRLMSSKYRAIFLFQHGMGEEAYAQLSGKEQDGIFRSLQVDHSDDDPRIVYAKNARFYANGGLNRMFQSMSEMLQALYIKEVGEIPDIEPLINWTGFRLGDTTAELFQYIYDKRDECYKGGGFLPDTVYDAIRAGIRGVNPIIERMVLGDGDKFENNTSPILDQLLLRYQME